MNTKFSEDIIPLTDLKITPDRVVKNAAQAHSSAFLTNRGRGIAAMPGERTFMRAVVSGLDDLQAGREASLQEAKIRLRL